MAYNQEQMDFFEWMTSSPENFISCLTIQDKETKKLIRFELNSEQKILLEALKKHNRIVIIKGRKCGVSTLLRAWAFYTVYCSTDPLQYPAVSKQAEQAEELHSFDKRFYKHLPAFMKRKLVRTNKKEIQFQDTEAKLECFTGKNPDALRGYSTAGLHLSEFAFYDDQDSMLRAGANVVSQHGQLVIETTPGVPNDRYHEIVLGAKNGENDWHLVELWWWMHADNRTTAPDDFVRTEEEIALAAKYNLDDDQLYWRRKEISSCGGVENFMHEHPACMEDAFRQHEAQFIPAKVFDDIKERKFTSPNEVYSESREDCKYYMGVDVSGGVGGDYASIHVVEGLTKRVVYHWRSNRTLPEALPDKILDVAKLYNNPLVLVEGNNHGILTLWRLRNELSYKNLWQDDDGKDWLTNEKNKYAAFANLREFLVAGLIPELDKITIQELKQLVQEKLAPAAPSKSNLHDDCAVSLALAYWCARKEKDTINPPKGRKSHVDQMIERAKVRRIRQQRLPWKANLPE